MPRVRQTPSGPPKGGDEPGSHTGPENSSVPTQLDMLTPYVLLAVSLQRAHGYLIEEYLRGLGFLSLEMSTLYRTLRQLEKDGLLYSSWEPGPAGPARRVYSLTDTGRSWLDSWAGMLEAYRGMIDRFFGLYGARPKSD
jgi:PadR family transcriptional regulator